MLVIKCCHDQRCSHFPASVIIQWAHETECPLCNSSFKGHSDDSCRKMGGEKDSVWIRTHSFSLFYYPVFYPLHSPSLHLCRPCLAHLTSFAFSSLLCSLPPFLLFSHFTLISLHPPSNSLDPPCLILTPSNIFLSQLNLSALLFSFCACVCVCLCPL